MAQTESPASHKSFIAVPPPAPVPTTITSNVFVSIRVFLNRVRWSCDLHGARFPQMRMLSIGRVRATRHGRPDHSQPGIAQTLQPNLRRVVTYYRVIPHQLEK